MVISGIYSLGDCSRNSIQTDRLLYINIHYWPYCMCEGMFVMFNGCPRSQAQYYNSINLKNNCSRFFQISPLRSEAQYWEVPINISIQIWNSPLRVALPVFCMIPPFCVTTGFSSIWSVQPRLWPAPPRSGPGKITDAITTRNGSTS